MESNPKTIDIQNLLTPIRADEIEWRVQSQTKSGDKLTVVPYISNRCVMERFDSIFGWDKWSNSYQEVEGGFVCTISVQLPDGRTISKSDAASRTAIEPVKGGVSDAMKRCAVQFGLGRDLYRYPKVMLQTTEKYIPDWAERLLDALVIKQNQAESQKAVIILKEEHAKNLPK